MNCYKVNMEIMDKLYKFLARNPDQRFGQALVNLNIVIPGEDLWFKESDEIKVEIEAALIALGEES